MSSPSEVSCSSVSSASVNRRMSARVRHSARINLVSQTFSNAFFGARRIKNIQLIDTLGQPADFPLGEAYGTVGLGLDSLAN